MSCYEQHTINLKHICTQRTMRQKHSFQTSQSQSQITNTTVMGGGGGYNYVVDPLLDVQITVAT